MRKFKEPTSTMLVLAKLVTAEDFMTVRQLMEATGITNNRVTAALCHLRKYKAVDFIADVNGTWWFATPDTDTRTRTVEERTPEAKPRKQRKQSKIN